MRVVAYPDEMMLGHCKKHRGTSVLVQGLRCTCSLDMMERPGHNLVVRKCPWVLVVAGSAYPTH